jgi:hypothetical protein
MTSAVSSLKGRGRPLAATATSFGVPGSAQLPRQAAGGAGPQPDFAPGASVMIGGLQGAAELNGRVGRVLRYASEQDRFHVDVAGEVKAVRAANLSATQGSAKLRVMAPSKLLTKPRLGATQPLATSGSLPRLG